MAIRRPAISTIEISRFYLSNFMYRSEEEKLNYFLCAVAQKRRISIWTRRMHIIQFSLIMQRELQATLESPGARVDLFDGIFVRNVRFLQEFNSSSVTKKITFERVVSRCSASQSRHQWGKANPTRLLFPAAPLNLANLHSYFLICPADNREMLFCRISFQSRQSNAEKRLRITHLKKFLCLLLLEKTSEFEY